MQKILLRTDDWLAWKSVKPNVVFSAYRERSSYANIQNYWCNVDEWLARYAHTKKHIGIDICGMWYVFFQNLCKLPCMDLLNRYPALIHSLTPIPTLKSIFSYLLKISYFSFWDKWAILWTLMIEDSLDGYGLLRFFPLSLLIYLTFSTLSFF